MFYISGNLVILHNVFNTSYWFISFSSIIYGFAYGETTRQKNFGVTKTILQKKNLVLIYNSVIASDASIKSKKKYISEENVIEN